MEFTYRGHSRQMPGLTAAVTWRDGAYVEGTRWLLNDLRVRVESRRPIALTPTGPTIECNLNDPQAAAAMVGEFLLATSFVADFKLPEVPVVPREAQA